MKIIRERKTFIMALTTAIIFTSSALLMSWDYMEYWTTTMPEEVQLAILDSLDEQNDLAFLPPLGNKSPFQAARDLSILHNKEVRRYVYAYLTRGRPYVIRSIERSYYYLPIIKEIMSKNQKIPGDLAYLPLLESGFLPRAVSRSGAMGLWQFMYSTGKSLGLQVNRYSDERRHLEKSTEAAIRHLSNLYSYFKSWELALAAYNGGGGHVSWALKKNKSKDFWKLQETDLLRKETREYVPRFLALLAIYHNQVFFGISDEITRPRKQDTVVVKVKYMISLKDISRETGITMAELRRYNPHIRGTYTPPCAINDGLRIPEDKVEEYTAARKKLFHLKISTIIPYKIKPRDTLSAISRRFKKKLLLS